MPRAAAADGVGTFDRLHVGDVFATPTRVVADADRDVVREVGGYTHPLFVDDAWVREHHPFPAGPVPGQFVLFLLGGLAEQSGVFDDSTLALVGLDEVRFRSPAMPGDTLSSSLEVLAKEPTSSGRRGTVRLRWTCVNQDGTEVLSAVATFLFELT